MKQIFFLLLLTPTFLFSQIPEGYYDGTELLSGQPLKTALNLIIDEHTEFPYTASSTDTWDILKLACRDTLVTNKVILIYTGQTIDAELEYNSGQGWSREHVWAKSHGDFGTATGIGTDAHNLWACDVSTNSAKNDKDFDNGGNEYLDGGVTYTGCFADPDSWEPRTEMKGDVARIILYMATRYEGTNGELDLEVVDYTPSYTVDEPYFGKMTTLLQWHIEDPVDDYERYRNDVIYSFQNNRNPFVDHPEFVGFIWGTETSISEPQRSHVRIADNILVFDDAIEIIVVYDLTGKLVSRDKDVILSKGAYIVSYVLENQLFSEKVIVS